MPSYVTAIPLDEGVPDHGVLGRRDDPRESVEGLGAGHLLAMQQLGLLASPDARVGCDRRLEDWIASQLDLSMEVQPARSSANIWNQLVERLPGMRRAPNRRTVRGGPETAFAEWTRFRVAYRRGITVVRLVDRALVKERHVRELTRDLIELIEAGNHRLVVNFQGIERAASWVALAVDEAYRRSKAADGGELKLCGLAAPLAAVLELAGMAPGIENYPDETSALDAPWPEPSNPRTLPVDILLALTAGPELPPIRGGAPRNPTVAGHPADRRSDARHRLDGLASPHGEPALWLIVQMGATKGRPVPVVGRRFLIGRQSDCQLRLGSPLVSKLHAAIERREGRIFVVDLGSTNGTIVNGRVLRSKEAELHDGDRIQVGPVIGTLATVAPREGSAKLEEQVAGWLHGERPAGHADQAGALDTAVIATSSPAASDVDPELGIRTEVIQDVLVVTPEVGELESDSTIELVRAHLQSLLTQPFPRRVVVNLEYVAHLTGQAIGVLLAHHLRLDRTGGCLRICQARARIMAVLHQVRLTMLVECHPTLDEAVLSAWPDPAKRAPDVD